MLNEEIYKTMTEVYGKELMIKFSDMAAFMYSLRVLDPPPAMDDLYDQHFWKLKSIHLNINTNEDGTDRCTV